MNSFSTPTSRRDFIKKAAMLSGSLGSFSCLPPSLARAVNITPREGSTFMDAKRVVILMQENRSFDHMFSTYRGVRGLRDPRAITLADGNPVYVQKNKEGKAYVPFWMDLHGSNSTWIGSCPHGRNDQVAASNQGKHDKWVTAKHKGGVNGMPMTMGYYDQRDIPFYHAFADSFTICDQHFSSMQGPTSPNRSYFWSGISRDPKAPDQQARTHNNQLIGTNLASWTTFPERLEEAKISWKFYQNELSQYTGLANETWLANYTNNNLEWFNQYYIECYPRYMEALRQNAGKLEADLAKIESELAENEKNLSQLEKASVSSEPSNITTASEDAQSKQLTEAQEALVKNRNSLIIAREKKKNSLKRLNQKLSELFSLDDPAMDQKSRELHLKAFGNNENDPHFREMREVEFEHQGKKQKLRVPAGDVLYQFRKDCEKGDLPAVSWLVAPEQFSDHPSAAWFGAWYVSEVLEILTKDPEVWKDTIFMLTYDENDGFYDHVPPYVPPLTGDEETGATSEGIDTQGEFDGPNGTGIPIGLGYRVPLLIASPWSRGGHVCSELFDHTSVLQFLEVFLADKGEKPIHESNISDWRRTICGDLTSAFRPSEGSSEKPLDFLERDSFIAKIERARTLKLPEFHSLTEEELADIRENPLKTKYLPLQEPGTRPSSGLAYELHLDGVLDYQQQQLQVSFICAKDFFGEKALGAPFQAYAPSGFSSDGLSPEAAKHEASEEKVYEKMRRWSFAVKAGDRISYHWPVAGFQHQKYHLEFHGPNGFFREMRGDGKIPEPTILCEYRENHELILSVKAAPELKEATQILIEFKAYQDARKVETLRPGEILKIPISLVKSSGWYDFHIKIQRNEAFLRRYAGRIESGKLSITDPMIGSGA